MAYGTPTHRNAKRSILHGPSEGVRLWTTYLQEVIDWLIDARKRWHEGAPVPATRGLRPRSLIGGSATFIVAVAIIIQRVAGG
jgi:hypothetical protein